jgi:hypothetical protein
MALRFAFPISLLPFFFAACAASGGTATTAGPESDASAAGDSSSGALDGSSDGGGGGSDSSNGGDSSGSASDGGDAADGGGPTQAMAIPMYMDPSAPDWAQAESAAPTVSLLIANPNSGPGASVSTAYTQAIAAAHAHGQSIIGYVHTTYGTRAIADVETDVDNWYKFYPAIDGIFVDEAANDATHVTSYYAPLYNYVKGKSGAHLVVLNPGLPPDETYMTACDIVMSFEDTYVHYVTATTPAWVSNYARSRFWHVILSASQTQMDNAVKLARQRNAGLIYVTDQGPTTAYQQLVTGAYWQAEIAAVSAP